jgi:Mg-chelatase subunit ChlD
VTGPDQEQERLRRWRMALGAAADAELGSPTGEDAAMDGALAALYDGAGQDGRTRTGGLGASAPRVARWLGDIREYFPTTVVQVMQADAIDRLGLTRLLVEPEMLAAVEPDVNLVATLLSLNRVLPERTVELARQVVAEVVADLEARITQKTRAAVTGALDRATRAARPRRHADIDWNRTIRANLKNYQPALRTVVPERLVGYGRRSSAVQRDVVLCVDQSGSMAASVVHAGVFAAVLASLRALRTSLVVFDTAVVDLTDQLADPVAVLFGTQLGGGTDINRALGYAQGLITRPRDSILVLISDLYEGGVRDEMVRRVASMVAAGVQVVVLLSLSDQGAPAYDHDNAAALAALGVPAFACTPDLFPELMAAAIERRDLRAFAERAQQA